MKRRLMILTASVLIFSGWYGAFMVTGLFGRTSLLLLPAVLLLGVGMGLLLKLTNIRQTVLALAVTAVAALVLLNTVTPQHAPRLSNLKGLKPTIHNLTVQTRDKRTFALNLKSHLPLDIRLFAELPGVARNMIVRTVDGYHQLFVSLSEMGVIYLLTDNDAAGYGDVPSLYHAGMDRPFGMAWVGDRLYVAEPSRILELHDSDGDGQIDQERVVVDGLPDDGGHWMRTLIADDQGMLYLSVGSRCNACEEEDQRRGTILRIHPQTGEVAEFARGLRNTVGLAFAPVDGSLWGADMGRQADVGYGALPDEINRMTPGGDYGWPYCFGPNRPDPLYGDTDRCRETIPARMLLSTRSLPISIAFDHPAQRDDRYHLYIVNSGFGTSILPDDYKVTRLAFNKNQLADKTTDFIWGWHRQDQGGGRPVAIAVTDGVMFISDEVNRAIYRITGFSP